LVLHKQPFTNGFQESSEPTVNPETFMIMLYKVIQMRLDAGPLAIQELNTLIKGFIAKHMLKHNQGAIRKNSKRILLAKSQNIENSLD
ncbi:26846_t:CDS:2, partial [Racocetra persica]